MDTNTIIIAVGFFAAGLITGSFLNVLIYKIPRKLTVFRHYAVCYSCRMNVSPIYNYPIIAYILKKGRCSYCKGRIPLQNILTEILNALLYVLLYLFFGISLRTLSGVILASILVTVSFIDWEFMIIPNIIVLPFTVVGLAINIIRNPSGWWVPLAFSAGSFAFLLIVHLIYPKGMGMGDVKLALMLGAFLVKNIIVGLFAGFLLGSVAGIIFLILKKKTLKQFIPFGPFISAGGIIALFTGDLVTGWYLRMF
ncbi:MAG: prepilin peptidase [Actinobacteria bacterium]|nr:prepilin peptidase [Actinomycetota bacterium]